MRVRLVGLMALTALVLASCGGASPEAGGPSEGIQVHGDWTIDIYNEDGSLDEHAEFSNDLISNGEGFLADVLSRDATVGDWQVNLFGSPQPCVDSSSGVACVIGEPDGHLVAGGNVFTTLGVTSDAGTLVLSGSAEAGQSTDIDSVGTVFISCAPTIAPNDCPTSTPDNSAGFTSNNSFTPVHVEAGQTVQVTVEISFTSG